MVEYILSSKMERTIYLNNLQMIALLEMICMHACYICTDIIHSSYYNGCMYIDDYAMLLTYIIQAIYLNNLRMIALL